jgi:type II secretory pathway pseudopilin PulG
MKIILNQNGFTYILALTIVVIMGIMLGLVGQSWKTISQREKEKELLFRGSQIKEAIENWNNPKYTSPGIPPRNRHPVMDLKDLLQDPYSLSKMRFLPHTYAAEVDDRNPKCAPDCAKLKIYQDPMTGKEWTIIRGSIGPNGPIPAPPGNVSSGIIGVASKSDEAPFRTDFKDTALEFMGQNPVSTALPSLGSIPQTTPTPTPTTMDVKTSPPSGPLGGKMTKYSDWQFIAESAQKNDHTKIYRAYHEGW